MQTFKKQHIFFCNGAIKRNVQRGGIMAELQYVELNNASVSQDVLKRFNCGHPDFNDFLINDAIEYSSNGNGVTYVLVDKKEYGNKTIFSRLQQFSLQHYNIMMSLIIKKYIVFPVLNLNILRLLRSFISR